MMYLSQRSLIAGLIGGVFIVLLQSVALSQGYSIPVPTRVALAVFIGVVIGLSERGER